MLENRTKAGRLLAIRLQDYQARRNLLVLAVSKLKDKIVILTDDGIATGTTMKFAARIVRQQNPQKIIIATPIIAKEALAEIEKEFEPVTAKQVGEWLR